MGVISKGKRVLVLMGGVSHEREISLVSGQAVMSALQDSGYQAVSLDVTSTQLFSKIQSLSPDIVFIALHGVFGESGHIQAILDAMGIPYTGSGVLASSLSMDKGLTKDVLMTHGIPTLPYARIASENDLEGVVDRLGVPLCLKPIDDGSSIGVHRIESQKQLHDEWRNDSSREWIAESWLMGNEYTVGILNGEPLPVIQIKTPDGFYDFTAKYESNQTQYCFDVDLTSDEIHYVQDISKKAFDVLSMNQWGRVDVMRDADGNFYVLELNSVPGLTPKSLVPMAAEKIGISFRQLICSLIESATCETFDNIKNDCFVE